MRYKKLSMNYVSKIKKTVLAIQLIAVFLNHQTSFFVVEKSKLTLLLGLHIIQLFEDSEIDLGVVDDVTVSDTPSWSQSEPQICLSVCDKI